MASTDAGLALLVQGLYNIQRIRYSELASSTIVLWDYFLTFDQEYELIWKSSWTAGKCLFLVNRYYTILTVIFNNYALFTSHLSDSCSALGLRWLQWQGWTGVIVFIIAELILQLRLYALYYLNKSILIFITVVAFSAAAASATIMGVALSKITANAHAIPGTPFCVPEGIPGYLYTFWIPMLISESVLCALAVYRGWQNTRRGTTLFQTGRRLVACLIRDSVVYFIIVFAAYLCNTVVFIVGTMNQIEIPIGFAVALSSVLGNRLCLNVRGMLRQDDEPSVYIATRRVENFALSRFSNYTGSISFGANDLTATELSELRDMRAHRVTAV